MQGQGVLAYWFDLVPEKQAEWADWYIRDHMPSRLGATFMGARCFRALSGEPEFMALYQTETVEALLAPEYLALLRNAPEGDRLRRGWYLKTVRGTCRVLASEGYGQGGIVGTIRFSLPDEGKAKAIQTIADKVAPSLASVKRVGRVNFLQADVSVRAKMDEARVTGHQDGSADCILCIECSAEDDVRVCLDHIIALQEWRSIKTTGTLDIGCYKLLYSIAK